MQQDVITLKNVTRNYKTSKGWLHRKKVVIKAVDNLNFSVKKGEVFGLLGENGAGKSTTIKMLITLLAPTSGECKVLGYNTYGEENKIRNKINFIMGGELGVYRRLSGRDNLRYFSNIYLLPKENREEKIDELLELVNLSEASNQLVETYSKGMIQRLQIARGLINDPEIVFMDEPTIGLDPVGARMLRSIIIKLRDEGKTVVLTTHYMYEADELCDRIAIMKKGKLIALDTPVNLKQTYKSKSHKSDVTLEDVYISLVGEV